MFNESNEINECAVIDTCVNGRNCLQNWDCSYDIDGFLSIGFTPAGPMTNEEYVPWKVNIRIWKCNDLRPACFINATSIQLQVIRTQ